jgi:hypothetical protein
MTKRNLAAAFFIAIALGVISLFYFSTNNSQDRKELFIMGITPISIFILHGIFSRLFDSNILKLTGVKFIKAAYISNFTIGVVAILFTCASKEYGYSSVYTSVGLGILCENPINVISRDSFYAFQFWVIFVWVITTFIWLAIDLHKIVKINSTLQTEN